MAADQTTIPTLYHLASSQSLRVLWALEELRDACNLQFHVKSYERVKGLAPPELKQVSQLGKAPILTVAAYDGASVSGSADAASGAAAAPPPPLKTLTEGRLILAYLAEQHAPPTLFHPSTPAQRERDLFFQEFANGTLRAKVDMALIFQLIPSAAPFPVRPLLRLLFNPLSSFFLKDVQEVLGVMEQALAEERWFGGEELGLADVNMCYPMDVVQQRGWLDRSKFPRLAEWQARYQARPAYRRAVERGPNYDFTKFDM